MKRYALKIWPEFYNPILTGEKTFELRKDDKGYRAGDMLNLREWTESEGYTGREILVEITYVLAGMGLNPGWIIMSFSRLSISGD